MIWLLGKIERFIFNMNKVLKFIFSFLLFIVVFLFFCSSYQNIFLNVNWYWSHRNQGRESRSYIGHGESKYLCNWIASFLTGRSIITVVNGFCSGYMPVNVGVPQGCVLSPKLLLLYINDMLKDSSIHCYADDSTVNAVYFGRASLCRENVD